MITATIAPVERRYELVPDGATGVIVDRMLDEPVADPRPVAHALAARCSSMQWSLIAPRPPSRS